MDWLANLLGSLIVREPLLVLALAVHVLVAGGAFWFTLWYTVPPDENGTSYFFLNAGPMDVAAAVAAGILSLGALQGLVTLLRRMPAWWRRLENS